MLRKRKRIDIGWNIEQIATDESDILAYCTKYQGRSVITVQCKLISSNLCQLSRVYGEYYCTFNLLVARLLTILRYSFNNISCTHVAIFWRDVADLLLCYFIPACWSILFLCCLFCKWCKQVMHSSSSLTHAVGMYQVGVSSFKCSHISWIEILLSKYM